MSKRSAKIIQEEQGTNFFVPMVDLMVSIIFVFIIIVMVLLLLIKDEATTTEEPSNDPVAAAAKGQETPVKPAIIDDAIVNQSAQEILFNDVLKDFLKKSGSDANLNVDSRKIEIKVLKPEKKQ